MIVDVLLLVALLALPLLPLLVSEPRPSPAVGVTAGGLW